MAGRDGIRGVPMTRRRIRLRFVLPMLLAAAGLAGAAARAEETNPTGACRAAIESVKTQPGYTARYKARIHKSGSDPFEQIGSAVRRGDLLYREGRREAEKEPSVRLYRRRDRLAVFEPRTEQWLTAEQAGDPNLGRGLEDPDVAMDFLLGAMGGAAPGNSVETIGGVSCRPYALALDRQKLAAKVRDQYEDAKGLDWEKADVSAQVLVGGEPALPRRFRINGVLPSKGASEGAVTLHIEVEVTGYGEPALPEPPKDVQEILGLK